MMMTRDLALRAVACPGWRRMERMRLIDSAGGAWTVLGVVDGAAYGWRGDYDPARGAYAGPIPADALPDLDDPATLGCLLALVREVWSDAKAFAGSDSAGEWDVGVERPGDRGRVFCGSTEAEALVAALEAAGGAK